MSDCPKCNDLKNRLDVAAELSIKAAVCFLLLNDGDPQQSMALKAMRRAKQEFDERMEIYNAHRNAG